MSIYPAEFKSGIGPHLAYDEMSDAPPLGPRPVSPEPLSMQQAVMRCHYEGIAPSRVNVARLLGQSVVEVSPITDQGNTRVIAPRFRRSNP